MKRKIYLNQSEQIELIKRLNLECAFEIGVKTNFITVGDYENRYDEFMVVLSLLENGTILQKWQCSKNEEDF